MPERGEFVVLKRKNLFNAVRFLESLQVDVEKGVEAGSRLSPDSVSKRVAASSTNDYGLYSFGASKYSCAVPDPAMLDQPQPFGKGCGARINLTLVEKVGDPPERLFLHKKDLVRILGYVEKLARELRLSVGGGR